MNKIIVYKAIITSLVTCQKIVEKDRYSNYKDQQEHIGSCFIVEW